MSSEISANPPPRAVLLALGLAAALGTGCPKSADTRRRAAPPVAEAAPAPAAAPAAVAALRDAPSTGMFPGRGPSVRPGIAWRVLVDGPLVHALATDGNAVFAVADGQVYCFGADGTERWRTRVGASGPPAVVDGGIAVSTNDDRVLVLDPATGLKVSEHPSGGPVSGPPLMLGSELVWVTEAGQVISAAGWAVTGSDSAVGGAGTDGERLFFGTQTGELVAVAAGGVAWRALMPGPATGRPAVKDGVVYGAYQGLVGQPGGVVAVDAASGSARWRTPIDRDPASSPSVSHMVLVPDRSGEMAGIDPVSGDRLWRAPVEGDLTTRPLLTRFSSYGGNADGRLHRFDPDDGGESWSVDLGATVSADPVLVGDRIVVGLADGSLVALGTL